MNDTIDWKKYLIVLLITGGLFFTAIYLSNYFGNQKLDQLKTIQDKIAIDILSSENNFQFSSDQKLKYVSWLEKNAPKFNFTISFPKDGKEYVYEPWHIRWYPPKQ